MRVLNAIIGILSVIVGFALLRTPFQSVEVVIFVSASSGSPRGSSRSSGHSSTSRDAAGIVPGLLGVIAGIIILTYPISSAVTLALIGGIWLIILGHHAGRRRRSSSETRSDLGGAARRLTEDLAGGLAGLRAILSRGADPAPTTLAASASPGTRRSSLRRSSVVERAAVNRLVVSSNLTAGAIFLGLTRRPGELHG